MTDQEILDILAELSPEGRQQLEKVLLKLRPAPKSQHQQDLEWWEKRQASWPTERHLRAALIGATAKQNPCFLAGHKPHECPERKKRKAKADQ